MSYNNCNNLTIYIDQTLGSRISSRLVNVLHFFFNLDLASAGGDRRLWCNVSSSSHWYFTMPAIFVIYLRDHLCPFTLHLTSTVRLLQCPAVQCCCNFLADFGWKGRLVSIPMVDRDRIFLPYLLYHYFPILVRCCHMPVWLEGYMLICWVRLERLAHG